MYLFTPMLDVLGKKKKFQKMFFGQFFTPVLNVLEARNDKIFPLPKFFWSSIV